MKVTPTEAKELALEVAQQSKCNKRKVGAVIVDNEGYVLSTGFNHNGIFPCESTDGETYAEVIHAEIAAIKQLGLIEPDIIYVTHEPCENCQKAIADAGISKVIIADKFMKFDTNKLRYDLIPTSATEALAQVLTYGAKKYKPNNWKEADDIERYIAALFRHFEALRSGEEFDPESGLRHSAHIMTNIVFINYFEVQKDKN
jgi:deoxycytidylate deaminase